MTPRNWWAESAEQPGAPGVRALAVSTEDWTRAAAELATGGARLLAMWASRTESPRTVHAAFLLDSGALLLNLSLAGAETPYPGLEPQHLLTDD